MYNLKKFVLFCNVLLARFKQKIKKFHQNVIRNQFFEFVEPSEKLKL